MNHHTGQIDGPGMTVEIDESKFGKLKFNRGRCIEGQWVFGGICRQTKACFLVPVGQRDKDTLLPIIRAHISPDTCVMSDMWKAYDCIKRRGLHSSHSQTQPKLRRPRHRCAHTAHWKYVVGSQTKYASHRNIQRSLRKLPTGMVVASALWRRTFWKHKQAYRRPIWSTQRCVNWSVPRTTVRDLIVASWKKETKYTTSTHGNKLEEGNQ